MVIKVLIRSGSVVLAQISGCQPFVTWYVKDGEYHWGHYFEALDKAKKDFKQRVKRGF